MADDHSRDEGLLLALETTRAVLALRRRADQERETESREQAERSAGLRDALARIQAVLESAPDGIAVFDSAGVCTANNRRFVELWRLPPDFGPGWHIDQVASTIAAQLAEPSVRLARVTAVELSADLPGAEVFTLIDGRRLERHLSPQMVDGEVVGVVVSWRDISARKPEPARAPHVLFVDDEEGLLTMVKRILRRSGCRVTALASAREALEVLRRDPPDVDLLLADQNMPEMSGLELAAAARLIAPKLRVAIASGALTAELAAEAEAVGVHEVVYKPDFPERLAAIVARLSPPAD